MEIIQKNSSDLDDYLIQKKMEYMIDTNNKKFANEIGKINETLNRLGAEISDIRRNMSKQPEPIKESMIKVPQTKSTEERKTEEIKPRYGDFGPDDVKIDQFFYFGKK